MPNTVDSLYDQLNASGTVAKQRFVETFSGDALDTDRWSTHSTGSGTEQFVMGDELNGGLKIVSRPNGASTIDFSPTDATKKRPFSQTGSVMILTSKLTQAQYAINYSGLRTNHYSEAGKYINVSFQGVTNGNSGDNKCRLVTNVGGNVDTSLSSSELYNWHTSKIEINSSGASLSIDGVLSGNGFATITGNADSNLHPALVSSSSEGSVSGGAVSNFGYLEVYNT